MTAPKWTPGPWMRQGGATTMENVAVSKTESCVIVTTGRDAVVVLAAAEEMLANAHLIAAAPMLYEALEALVAGVEDAVLRFLSCGVVLRPDMEAVLLARVERARTALKRARGDNGIG